MNDKLIDDESTAMEAILSAPEITDISEEKTPEIKADKIGKAPIELIAIDADKAKKEAEALNSGINSAYKGFTNEDLDENQKQIFSSFFGAVFEYMQGQKISPIARIGIFGGMALMAISPTILKMINAGKAK